MELTSGQKEFLRLVESGKNVFLTGKAGTGKSLAVHKAKEMLSQMDKNVVCVAPTGIAATNIKGQTIHSFFSIRPYGIMDEEACNFVKIDRRRIFSAIDTLIIDEVSMLRPDLLDAIHWTLRKNMCRGLNKIQVILVGDLKQLPAVLKDDEKSVLYETYKGSTFHFANVYDSLKLVTVDLVENKRQSDPDFLEALNEIRDGRKHPYFKQFVHTETRGIILCPHNETADYYNKKGLRDIRKPLITLNAVIEGEIRPGDVPFPLTIEVKHGAKIMYLVNSPDAPIVNGTLGTFVVKDGNYFIKVGEVEYPMATYTLEKFKYVLSNEKLVLQKVGIIIQYPFKLAFALSIHKSQGLTLEEVTLDLRRPCFENGQMYVALSRVTGPQGLRIIVK